MPLHRFAVYNTTTGKLIKGNFSNRADALHASRYYVIRLGIRVTVKRQKTYNT